jgi:hypothetical protein
MNDCDPRLREGLRALAGDGPQEAPAFVEEKLVNEFQRSRARRRNLRVLVATGAIAAGIAAMLWFRPAPTAQPAQSAEVIEAASQDEEGFYRLPEADELPPMESAMVVRVELPMSSLRLMGVPINDERADEAVEADVLLAQDGLARGVRLVE